MAAQLVEATFNQAQGDRLAGRVRVAVDVDRESVLVTRGLPRCQCVSVPSCVRCSALRRDCEGVYVRLRSNSTNSADKKAGAQRQPGFARSADSRG
jgi:hypothetical protein